MKIRQIDFNEALDLVKAGKTVYAINLTADGKPTLKRFGSLTVKDSLETDKFIFFVLEEA